ncbi:MAG: DEAD/DEAH box helicase [Planctomycetales bacterium]|nr:DEAD/DEAH box helicase [Planctomycetales bacterium]
MTTPQPPDSQPNTRRDPVVRSVYNDQLNLAPPTNLPFDWLLEPPAAVTVPLETITVKTTGYVFPEGAACLVPVSQPASEFTPPPPQPSLAPSPSAGHSTAIAAETVDYVSLNLESCTRVRPPQDVVKLEDRLLYLLQPPLERVFANESLSFPFQPFPYQLDGIAFLYPRNEAVIADEMGLGKTMQAIVAMRLLAHQGQARRILLVCPKPLVTNWQREIALWAPELPVAVVDGKQSRRQWLWENVDSGVLLSNYESLLRDREAAASAPFDLVIIDESQRIKNRLSATNQAVCSIPRRRSWALTGTPIENSVEDLVGIFQFVSPGCLRPQMKVSTIRSAVKDHVVRRTKDQVLTELPPKLFRDADLALSPEQQQAYQLAEEQGIVRLHEMKRELTIQHVFELVLRLKQICNFDPATGVSAKADRLEADLEECAASGRKAIVFSQWVHSIELLHERLQRFGPLQYHGKVPPKRRDHVLDQFRNDPDRHVLLMSYGAGSVGLNLQFAGYVFLFDRWWNPAVEDQAINRAHRIGAAGPVTVTRFLCSGTIEERINTVLEEKRELFNSVFDPASPTSPASKLGLSREDIFGLFQLQFPDAAA